MGVETELLGVKNRWDGKEFQVIERENGDIAVLAGGKVLVDSGVTPVTAVPSASGNRIFAGDDEIELGGASSADAVPFAPASTYDPASTVLEAVVKAAQAPSARVAFVFDDGYLSNYTNALPIFKRYGFAATVACEIERIGSFYNNNTGYPVCRVAEFREMIEAGWEICNHPNLNTAATEQVMVQTAQAEHQLLRDLLSGAKTKNYATGVVSAGVVDRPEFVNYPITTAVYRGGARNETSDRAYRYLFDKVRSINGPVASRGNFLYSFGPFAERTTQMSAFPIDTTSNPVEKTLAFLESIAQTKSDAIIYAHDTPTAYVDATTPYILAADLARVLARCAELGISVIPLAKLWKGNALADPHFDLSMGTFSARAGDTAAWATADTLHSAARAIQLTSSAIVSSDNTQWKSDAFVVEPYCRYRVRVRYKIDVDLDIGGAVNRNRGLNVRLYTLEANTDGAEAGNHSAANVVLNDAVSRIPYLATAGVYEEFSTVLCTCNGAAGQLVISLNGAIGTAKVGNIIVEKLESLVTAPLSGISAFDSYLGKLLYLPNTGSGARGMDWDVQIFATALEASGTYNFAFSDSASVPAPAAGNTCYVLGSGAGAFSGQGGMLATYNGSSWTFSAVTVGAFFKVTSFRGLTNRWVRHIGIGEGVGHYEVHMTSVLNDKFPVVRVNNGTYRVFNGAGTRTDAFSWVARPKTL